MMSDTKHTFLKQIEIMKLCDTLNTMGYFKIYGNDGKTETLRFKTKRPFATQIGTDFAADCLRKIGFINVQNNPDKDFFHSVSATIVCEYDLTTKTITKANPADIQALFYIFDYAKNRCNIFLPTASGQEQLPFNKHKNDLKRYLYTQNTK